MSNDAADATITKREKPFEYMNRTVHSPYLLDYARSGRSKVIFFENKKIVPNI